MKRLWIIPVIGALAALAVMATSNDTFGQISYGIASRTMTVDENAHLPMTHRVGVNLGTWSTWGAEQLPCNIIMNPGFEGKRDRIIVIVSRVSDNSFFDERGLNHPDGYWNGATYDIRTGPSAGKTGKIKQSYSTGPGDLPQYIVDGPMPELNDKDVIVLNQTHQDINPVAIWWIPRSAGNSIHVDPKEHRPGSEGVQSLVLEPRSGVLAEAQFYWDGIFERAGKLLMVNGPWRFSIWAKAESEGAALDINFQRLNGTGPFLRKIVELTTDWEEYVYDFEGVDDGPPQFLKLGLTGLGQKVKIWLDDVSLCSIQQETPTPFRKDVVEALKEIRPYCIRDHQGQLGDSFENRIAPVYKRGAFRYRVAGGGPQWWFGYSNPDLLDLCEYVKSYPWIIMPPVYSDEECLAFGKFLAEHANKERFDEVYVEFGNENWNWIFRAAGIPYPKPCGEAADRAFRLIKEGAGNQVNLNAIINGQYAVPSLALQFLKYCKHADQLAVAPYYCYSLSAKQTDEKSLHALFADTDKPLKSVAAGVKELGKKLSVYEVNAHTTQGDADFAERNRVVAGAASGTALVRRLLQGVYNGAHPQNVFVLAGFDVGVANVDEWARLWGIYRDLSPTNRPRPTGLGMAMLNKVLGGSLHKVNSGEDITSAAFRTEKNWKAVFASENPSPVLVELTFPDDGRDLPGGMLYLDAISPFDTNEEYEGVRISEGDLTIDGRTVRFTIPAWGLVVLPAAIDIPKREEGLPEPGDINKLL
ncbi:MAG: hypothetical protein KDK72_07095 [Chlamydiia bacterium]|nr:hypothetical protein [Chlamydiia bacterium]